MTNKIVYGNIITMSDSKAKAEAMFIENEKVSFVGTKEEVSKCINEQTEIIDFGSSTIYPGFIDTHSHVGLLTTMISGGANFPFKESYEQTVENITKYIKANPSKEIYKAFYFTSDVKRGFPTHDLLDAIEIDGKRFNKPIIIVELSGHLCWLNKVAMDKFNVNKDLVKKYGEDVVLCDSNGEPIGCVKETPHFKIMGSIPSELDEAKKYIMQFHDIHLNHGYSMIADCGIDEGAIPMISAMSELAKENKFKLKIRAYYQIFESSKDPLKELDLAIEYAKKYNYDNFKIVGIKIFLDGVSEGMSAWTLNPYKHYRYNNKPYYGYKRWNYDRIDELAKIISKANANGLSMQFHAYGPGSVRYALDAIEKAKEGFNSLNNRNAISHLINVDKSDVSRFTKLNVSAVSAPHWYIFNPTNVNAEKIIYGDPETDKDLNDQGYLECGFLKSFLDVGTNLAFHSDGAPATPPSEIIFAAVNKYSSIVDPNMKPRNLKESISAYDAIKCMTINPAYTLKEENNVGSLEVGKQADFVVYDVDFTDKNTITNPEYCNIQPKSLYINGEKIF